VKVRGINNSAIVIVTQQRKWTDRAGIVPLVSIANDPIAPGRTAFHNNEGTYGPVVFTHIRIVVGRPTKVGTNQQCDSIGESGCFSAFPEEID
jgi:hypothetical protein